MPKPEAAQAELLNTTCHHFELHFKQLMAYAYCVRDYGANHQWMGFIDTDEFVVLKNESESLAGVLRDYEGYGALALNWRMFGSSE